MIARLDRNKMKKKKKKEKHGKEAGQHRIIIYIYLEIRTYNIYYIHLFRNKNGSREQESRK